MPLASRLVIAAVAAISAGRSSAADISNDRLCRAIGETPNVAVPPRDRAFFQDHCECLIGECAYKGSARHRQLIAAVKCKAYVRTAAAKELGREIEVEDAVGYIDEFRIVVERLCLKHGSGPKVLAAVKPAIKEQKRRDLVSAESKKREEAEVAEKQRLYSEEVQRANWDQTQERVRAHLASGSWEPAVAETIRVFIACLGDTARPSCGREASFFWEICGARNGDPAHAQSDSRYCQAEYNRAMAAQLGEGR
jgi:hypothetical protein